VDDGNHNMREYRIHGYVTISYNLNFIY